MTAAELIAAYRVVTSEGQRFLLLAESIYEAQLKDGRHVLDAIDFRDWFLELAEESCSSNLPYTPERSHK